MSYVTYLSNTHGYSYELPHNELEVKMAMGWVLRVFQSDLTIMVRIWNFIKYVCERFGFKQFLVIQI